MSCYRKFRYIQRLDRLYVLGPTVNYLVSTFMHTHESEAGSQVQNVLGNHGKRTALAPSHTDDTVYSCVASVSAPFEEDASVHDCGPSMKWWNHVMEENASVRSGEQT